MKSSARSASAWRFEPTTLVLALYIDDLLAMARSRLTRSWTEDECRSYLHLDRCPPTLR